MEQIKPAWLEKDVLADNEKKFGKNHYSEFNQLENAISMLDFMDHNEKKRSYYKSINDTYWGIKWNDFLQIMIDNGFEVVLEDEFPNHQQNNRLEKFIILAHKGKGLLVKAESYGDCINSGDCYGQATQKDHFNKWFPISCSGGYDENGVISWHKDIREGLLLNLQTIEQDMTLLSKWTNPDVFLYLVDFSQTKVEGYNYKEITNERLSRCPQWVRVMISRE